MSTLLARRWFFLLLIVLVLIPVAWNCENGSGGFTPNRLPITRLANVPPPDTEITTPNPRLTLSWIGDDPDGYVIAFRYRWSFRENASSPTLYHEWKTILNLWDLAGAGQSGSDNFALLTDAAVSNLPNVYHHFSVLLNGLDTTTANALANGDSILVEGAHVWASNTKFEQYPVHTRPTSGTFIFDSPDTLNPHTFEVLSVDNVAAEGLPASITFFTPRVAPPRTRITLSPGDTAMVLMNATATFPGINFQFEGFDPNSRTIDYEWVIDRDKWPAGQVPWSDFSPATSVFVTAKDFPDPYATNHTFYVRARNEFGVIDTVGQYVAAVYDANSVIIGYDTVKANVDFQTLYPPFARPNSVNRTLVLTNSYPWKDATPSRPSLAMLDAYYKQMLDNAGKSGTYDFYDVHYNSSLEKIYPGRGFLGQYSLIIFLCDAINYGVTWGYDSLGNSGVPPEIKGKLEDYLNVGGRMIISSWALPWAINAGASDNFMSYVCHLQDINRATQDTGQIGFIGAQGQKGYPDVVWDSTKTDTLWTPVHYIFGGRPYGFGEKLYLYQSPSPYILSGTTVATRYIGVTYDVIYFGFPLYYIQVPGSPYQPSATSLLRQAMMDLGQ